MYMRSLLLILCLALTSSLLAEPVVIVGKAPTHVGKEIAVFETLDLISGKRELVNYTRVEEDGSFRLQFELAQEASLDIQVMNLIARLYTIPGEQYEVDFPTHSEAKVYAFDYLDVVLDVKQEDPRGVNASLQGFDNDYAAFWAKYENHFHMLRSSGSASYDASRGKESDEESAEEHNPVDTEELLAAIELFEKNTLNAYGRAMENEYVAHYIEFAIARLMYGSGLKREQIYRDYLVDAGVHYNNAMYINFIKEFYHEFLRTTDTETAKSAMKAVNARRSYADLDSTIVSDLTVGEDELRQLVLSHALKEAFFFQTYSRDGILTVLGQQAELADAYPEVSAIAANLLTTIKKGIRGYEVPDFEMLDHEDNKVKLSDYRGKYVYLGFFTSSCESCEKEMLLMKKIFTKNPGIEVVSASMDYNYYSFQTYLATHVDFDWTFLYGPSERMIRDYLPLRSVPEFYLIDPEGKLMYNYTRKPSEGISLMLEGIRKRQNGGKKPSTERKRE
jgi:peroxiredoxin